MTDPDAARTSARRGAAARRLAGLAGGAAGIAALVVVFSSSGGVDDVAGALSDISPGWTLAALGATVATYLLNAVHLRRLCRGDISLRRAARADLLLFGLGNVLPGSPAPGVALGARELRRGGLSRGRARLAMAFTMWFNVRTLLLIGAVTFLVAFVRQAPGLKEAGAWWLGAIGVLVLLAASARVAAHPESSARAARVVARVRIGRFSLSPRINDAAAYRLHAAARDMVGSRSNRLLLASLATASWLTDALCLRFTLAAAGVHLDTDVVLLAYVAGVLAGGLPLLPAGAGAVEAAVPALLHHFGAPVQAALAGTLVYRGISTLVPAALGAVVLVASRWRRPATPPP